MDTALMLLPWLALAACLFVDDRVQRVRRIAIAMAFVVAVNLIITIVLTEEEARMTSPMMLGLFGALPVLAALVLAFMYPQRHRMRILTIIGGVIAAIALASATTAFVVGGWPPSAEVMFDGLLSMLVPLLGYAAMGAVLSISAFRATKDLRS